MIGLSSGQYRSDRLHRQSGPESVSKAYQRRCYCSEYYLAVDLVDEVARSASVNL